jgi:hypothetical protein
VVELVLADVVHQHGPEHAGRRPRCQQPPVNRADVAHAENIPQVGGDGGEPSVIHAPAAEARTGDDALPVEQAGCGGLARHGRCLPLMPSDQYLGPGSGHPRAPAPVPFARIPAFAGMTGEQVRVLAN